MGGLDTYLAGYLPTHPPTWLSLPVYRTSRVRLVRTHSEGPVSPVPLRRSALCPMSLCSVSRAPSVTAHTAFTSASQAAASLHLSSRQKKRNQASPDVKWRWIAKKALHLSSLLLGGI